MILLGFYIGRHDSSVAAAVDGRVRYAKSERQTGIKHHRADLTFVMRMCQEWNIRPDLVAFSDGNRNNLGICPRDELACEVAPVLPFPARTFCVDHHYAHILSTWPVIDTDRIDVGFALDGNGDHDYRRRVIAEPGRSTARSIHDGTTPSFGMVLEKIGLLMQLGGHLEDLVGKVMGAQAYGEVDHAFLDALDDADDVVENRIYDFIRAIPWRGAIPEPAPRIVHNPWPLWQPATQPEFFRFENQSFRDWLATIHHAIERHVEQFFMRFATPDQVIGYAGGCAQNVVCNERLARLFPQLHTVPHGYDGGLSLGCLEYLRIHQGLPRFATDGFPYWQDDDEPTEPSAATIAKVADLLADGKIVGWFQGRGEIGPRALGHRSILMSPALPDGKDVLNERVKHREPWRPYAPSVLESQVSEWFELEEPSRFMLRSVRTRDDRRDQIPSIVHADGTSRVQTVPEDRREVAPFVDLIEQFRRRTGIPMLLNTSLNAGGSPIFGSREQSLAFYHSVPMDAICLGRELLVK